MFTVIFADKVFRVNARYLAQFKDTARQLGKEILAIERDSE